MTIDRLYAMSTCEMKVTFSFLLFVCIISCCLSLQCYVCTSQFDNRDKCVKSSVQCEQFQDTCMTHIQLKAPDFWTPRSEKIHIIEKRCGTRASCHQKQRQTSLRAMRDWYRDWEYYECCHGDYCNYYVTLGAGRSTFSLLLLSLSALSVRWLCQ